MCFLWTMINCHCVVIESVLLFSVVAWQSFRIFSFPFFFLPSLPPQIFHVFHRLPKPKPVQRLTDFMLSALASSLFHFLAYGGKIAIDASWFL